MMFIETTDECGYPCMINLDRVRKIARWMTDDFGCTVTYESGGEECLDIAYDTLVEFLDEQGLLHFRETGVHIVPKGGEA